MRLTLNTLNFLKEQMMNQFKNSNSGVQFWQTEFWKGINLLNVAKAATQCSAYFTALLYVELWIEQEHGQVFFISNYQLMF